jgi:formyltetrahydrofolate synthetase
MAKVSSDIEIAQSTKLKPIKEIASQLGIQEMELEPYGHYMGKVNLDILLRLKDRPKGKFITVTAITPTPLGEGKTVTNIGVGQGLNKIGKKVINTLRQPSKGPTFGIKGGACGGGYSQVLPMENINLHFTGDVHAVETAHNLFNAAMDAHILHGNKLNIDPLQINLRRVVDLNDRALREIVVGLGGRENGYPRQTGYDITVASETAAILALSTSLKDLRERIGRMICGFTYDRKPITAEDLRVAGAMTALLADALKPNLVQSTENHPIFDHGFPFANVAHGNNSIVADMVALKLADYVVTESGFGADCGAEKLINVVLRQWRKVPGWEDTRLDCVVITTSIRGLKMHGGAFVLKPGQSYASIKEKAEMEDMPALERGCQNLRVHIENMASHGIPVVVTINRFLSDTQREIDFVKKFAESQKGVYRAVPIEAWAKGGAGCIEAAHAVVEACQQPNSFHLTYPDDVSIKEKIETIATKIYRADGAEYSAEANRKIKMYEDLGFEGLCLNMAKTHLSLSHDPSLKGVPKNYKVPIRDVRISAGAGFLYPLLGDMRTMPGLPSNPAFLPVDVDLNTGKIKGLF